MARRLRKVLKSHPGPCLVCLDIGNTEIGVQTVVTAKDTLRVSPDDTFLRDLACQFPETNVSLG